MIHILTHLVGDALADQVKGDGGARPDLRSQRLSAGGELRSYSVFGAVIRLQYFFFLKIGESAGDICFVALAQVCETGGGDLAFIAVQHQQVQGVRATQPVLLHFFCRDLVPVSGNVKNIQSKMFKTVIHHAILSARGEVQIGVLSPLEGPQSEPEQPYFTAPDLK